MPDKRPYINSFGGDPTGLAGNNSSRGARELGSLGGLPTGADDVIKRFLADIGEVDPGLVREQQSVMLRPGDVLQERFLVVELRGFGGMGAVYRVRDRILGEDRALKIMLPSLLRSETARERFVSEVRLSQQLNHDGIVRVHDLNEDRERGLQFFTMEYVEGRTLHRLLSASGGQLPIAQALDITRQLCDALEYAHQHTVHRDLKPQNIMVRPDGRIKVLDFGLAKVMSPGRLTKSSMALGTAYYQAPEQSVHLGEVDRRADIYSVGVMLYQMLTGEMPVGRFKKPSRLRPGISPSLDDVVMRCLEPRKEDRYPDAAALRVALNGDTKRSVKIVWALVLGGLVMVAVVTGGVYYRLKERSAPIRADLSAQESASPAKSSAPSEAVTTSLPPDALPDTAEARRTADETEQLNTTKEEMITAKTTADALEASRWAQNNYGQAQQKETAAAQARGYLEATKLYTEARVLYAAAADETKRLGEALAAAEKAAEEVRAKAGTEEVSQYASVELGEADKLFASANDAAGDFIQAKALYEQAEGKYTEALRLATERRREKTSQVEESNRLHSDIESLVMRYLNIQDGEELERIFNDLFGSSVDYYDGGIVSRETILEDKLQYYKRWPVRQMRLASEIQIQTGVMPDVYDVSYDIFFEVWSPERSSGIKGKATNIMKLQKQQGELKIIAEKQTVLERTTLSSR